MYRTAQRGRSHLVVAFCFHCYSEKTTEHVSQWLGCPPDCFNLPIYRYVSVTAVKAPLNPFYSYEGLQQLERYSETHVHSLIKQALKATIESNRESIELFINISRPCACLAIKPQYALKVTSQQVHLTFKAWSDKIWSVWRHQSLIHHQCRDDFTLKKNMSCTSCSVLAPNLFWSVLSSFGAPCHVSDILELLEAIALLNVQKFLHPKGMWHIVCM